MYRNLLFSCLLALCSPAQAVMPAPGLLTRAIATILFRLPFLDCAGIISADIIETNDNLQADIICATCDYTTTDNTTTCNNLEPDEDALFFEGFLDTDDHYIKIWKFNRNPDACFRIRLKFRNAAVIE